MASSQSSDEEEAWSPWNTLDETVVEATLISEEGGTFNSDYYTSDESFKTPSQSFEIEEPTVRNNSDATDNLLTDLTAEGNSEESAGYEEEVHDVIVNPCETIQVLKEDSHDESKEFQEEPAFIRDEVDTEAKSKVIIADLQDDSKEDSGIHSEVGLQIDSKESSNISCEADQEDPTITKEVSFTSPHQLSPPFEDQDTFGVLHWNFQTPTSVFSSVQCGPRKRPSSCCKSTRRCFNHNFVATPTQIVAIPFELPLTPVRNEEQGQEDATPILLDKFTSPSRYEDETSSWINSIDVCEEAGETLGDKIANIAMIESHVSIQNSLEKLHKITSGMPTVNDRNQKDDVLRELSDLSAYQKYGLRWLLWREEHFPEGGILVGDVGFDKPAIFKGLIMNSKDYYKPTLIVCPSIKVLNQWERNFNKKSLGLQFYIYHGSRRTMNANKLKQYDVVLTTYHIIAAENPKNPSAVLHPSPLMKVYWHRIILDKAEEISKLNLVRTQAILKLEGRHRWAVLWESPPRKNVSPKDIQSIVKFLQLKPFDDDEIWEYLFEGVEESEDGREERNEIVAEIILNSLIPPARH